MRFVPTGTAWVLAALLATGWLISPLSQVCAQESDLPAIPTDLSAPALGDTTNFSKRLELVELDPDNLLVLEIRIDKKTSGHGVLAYNHGDHVMLPLGGLRRAGLQSRRPRDAAARRSHLDSRAGDHGGFDQRSGRRLDHH